MKYYVEAYRADGSQVLGKLDGQAVLRAKDYRQTKHYKRLRNGVNRPTYSRVYRWKVVDETGRCCEFVLNKWRNVL